MFTVIIVSIVVLACQTSALFEGYTCIVPNTTVNGQCLQVKNCQYALSILRNNGNPGICGFKGGSPLVCCPQNPSQNPKLQIGIVGIKSQEKCYEYHEWMDYKIVGRGEPALAKEFPHMAAVGYAENRTSIIWSCGGSLISHRFVLSAAHCAYSINFGPAQWIRLGDLDLKNTTEDASPRDIKINQTYVHPDYKPSSHYHDIALFKMERSTEFQEYFKPACLHVKKELPVDTLQVIGWGQVVYLGDTSSHLQKANLSVVDHKTCAKRYANVAKSRKLSNGVLDMYQICAGDADGRDTCPGDSGGPLHYAKNSSEKYFFHFVVAGVTSFGKGCAGEHSVGVYTRVSSYVGWIESIVWKEGELD